MFQAADWQRTPHSLPAPKGERLLLVDGDGLAYTQAGPSGTTKEQARHNLIYKVRSAQRAVQATDVLVLLTQGGSHKGHRYAIATVKPYQGQRSSGRRPDQWAYLRGLLEARAFDFPIESTLDAEADDLFAYYAARRQEAVILTQDKDMRMIPAIHLSWDDHLVIDTRDGSEPEVWGKQYGTRWFWLQMLTGDTADNIPGLPKYRHNGKDKPIGKVTAEKFLAGLSPAEVPHKVLDLYAAYYGDSWGEHVLEQAALLWMRRNPKDVLDVCAKGNPLHNLIDQTTKDTILARIVE